MCSADAPETIEDRKCGDTATRQEAGSHAKKQGKIVLIDVVHNADCLPGLFTQCLYRREALSRMPVSMVSKHCPQPFGSRGESLDL
jgi:hypothetical protein